MNFSFYKAHAIRALSDEFRVIRVNKSPEIAH